MDAPFMCHQFRFYGMDSILVLEKQLVLVWFDSFPQTQVIPYLLLRLMWLRSFQLVVTKITIKYSLDSLTLFSSKIIVILLPGSMNKS
jgi:hypothetical protein